jgi:hypothetical protein
MSLFYGSDANCKRNNAKCIRQVSMLSVRNLELFEFNQFAFRIAYIVCTTVPAHCRKPPLIHKPAFHLLINQHIVGEVNEDRRSFLIVVGRAVVTSRKLEAEPLNDLNQSIPTPTSIRFRCQLGAVGRK